MAQKYLIVFLLLFILISAASAADVSFVREGERWVCFGNSITAAGTYPAILERVFNHYHPKAAFTVINSGQAGDIATTDEKEFASRVLKHKPTVVSLMFGMNESILYWRKGQPKEPVQAKYRKALTYIARACKTNSIDLIFMTPTLTDEAFSTSSIFNLPGTGQFLRECAAIMKEVADLEGAYLVPLQKEFEALQESVLTEQVLRIEGVHPSSVGAYQIARSLWEHCGFHLPLAKGKRGFYKKLPEPLDVKLKLSNRFLGVAKPLIEVVFESAKPQTIHLTWSLRGNYNTQKLKIKSGVKWSQLLPAGAFPQESGQSGKLIFDLAGKGQQSLYIIDLARTGVVHGVDGVFSGVVESLKPRSEGSRVANWSFKLMGKSLLFEGEVFDSEILDTDDWPWGRDGFNMILDFRPNDRFAGIGLDADVHQTVINIHKDPFFAAQLQPWLGVGMANAAFAGGEPTAKGYKTRMCVHGKWSLSRHVDFSKHDFIGIDMCVVDLDSKGRAFHHAQAGDQPMDQFANGLLILDLKNTLPWDETITANLFGR